MVDINGKVEIVCSSEESKVEITYDENILPYVATEMKNGVLELGQHKWIEGTKEVEIKIYTKELSELENDSWSNVRLVNIDQEQLKVISSISDIYLSGKVDQLKIRSESSTINAFDLEAKHADVRVKEDGRVFVNATTSLEAKNSKEGEIRYKGEPGKISGSVEPSDTFVERQPIDTRYIEVKFRNNSSSTIQAYVKGPKPDGKYFSYGLPFRPMVTKTEHWTIGTKLYKVNKLGMRKLLHKVTAEDKGKIIILKG